MTLNPLRLMSRTVRLVFLAIVVVACLGPVAWVVLSSFKTQTQVFASGGVIPNPFSWRGYDSLFSQIDVVRLLANTFLYAVCGTLVALAAGFLAAYPAARLQFPLRQTLTVLFSVGLAVPITGLIVPEFVIMQHLDLFNTRVGMILFYGAMWFPLTFVILRTFLSSLPPSLEEAASLDGAGYFQLLGRVVLPLARPGLATAAVLVFINIWNDFLFNLLLAPSPQNQNVQVGLQQFQGAFGTDITAILAGTTVMMVIPVLTFIVLQRYVIAGLTAGSSR